MSEPIGYFDVEEGVFAIVSKAFWDANPIKVLDADGLDEATAARLPAEFYEIAESAYEHTFSTDEEAVEALESAGFERGTFSFSA